MNINKDNTLIVFGGSPYIKEIQHLIPNIQANYDTLGLNLLPTSYPNFKYWCWCDLYLTSFFKDFSLQNYIIITTKEVKKRELDLLNIPLNPNNFYFQETIENIPIKKHEQRLLIWKTSVHAAINYAIVSGFKNVVLIGIDLEENWGHYYSEENVRRPARRIQRMREYLYNFKEYINIYKTNKNNTLDLEWIDIDGFI